jgi:endogenous inhibitor of DNA gyrase (YacG/DUF329 family)
MAAGDGGPVWNSGAVTDVATTVPCPTCGRPVLWCPASRFRPFCSERCRLIDLGEWLTEGHVIPEPFEGSMPESGTEDRWDLGDQPSSPDRSR